MSGLRLDSLDKSDWPTYRFDQIAEHIRETVDPNTTELEVYIGLEHLDPESIHIRRHGQRSDVSGNKLRCYPGDVIFGKRRAYQRKAAIVEQDAFCSAHAMVLRAKPEVIDPKLFPFFLHSDAFMHRAVDISVGSLSPTINWTALKKQEFPLPPKEQHDTLAELLWLADKNIEAQISLRRAIKSTKASYLMEAFSRNICDRVRLSNISENLDGARKPVKKGDRKPGPTPYFGASGIVDYVEGYTHDQPLLLISEDGENLNSRKLPIAYEVDGKAWVNNHAHAISIPKELRHLVCEYLNSTDISDFISGTTRPKLTKGTLDDLPINLPKFDVRQKRLDDLMLLNRSISNTAQAVATAKNAQKSLINQIF